MHPCPASCAFVAAPVGCPSVKWALPGLGTLLYEVLFPLLSVLALLSGRFVVNEVLFVIKDLLKSLDSMGVDVPVVLVQGLPFCESSIMEGISSFPGCECCVSLPPAELGLTAGCVRCPGVSADVEHCDAAPVLVGDLIKEVWVWVVMRLLVPCLRN